MARCPTPMQAVRTVPLRRRSDSIWGLIQGLRCRPSLGGRITGTLSSTRPGAKARTTARSHQPPARRSQPNSHSRLITCHRSSAALLPCAQACRTQQINSVAAAMPYNTRRACKRTALTVLIQSSGA
jgi:hypothetical protein